MHNTDHVCEQCHKPLTANESRCNCCGFDPNGNHTAGREEPSSIGGLPLTEVKQLLGLK